MIPKVAGTAGRNGPIPDLGWLGLATGLKKATLWPMGLNVVYRLVVARLVATDWDGIEEAALAVDILIFRHRLKEGVKGKPLCSRHDAVQCKSADDLICPSGDVAPERLDLAQSGDPSCRSRQKHCGGYSSCCRSRPGIHEVVIGLVGERVRPGVVRQNGSPGS